MVKNKNLNPYRFFETLYNKLKSTDKVILGNGTAFVVGLQCADLKKFKEFLQIQDQLQWDMTFQLL